MEKYRGPSDQHSRMEKKYFAQLIFGIFLILLAIPLETYRTGLGDVEIRQPLPPGGEDRPEPVRIQTNTSSALSFMVIIAGTIMNIHSIYRYRNEYNEIREKYTRPANIFVIVGITVTLIVLGISLSSL
tara:strand:- start:2740 stop:3126 length:387 start_codon:yes stop_codon:yes gene_type:complete